MTHPRLLAVAAIAVLLAGFGTAWADPSLRPSAVVSGEAGRSTGMSRMSDSLLRSFLGQRTEMSKSFSPSIMLDWARAPRALLTTLLTSAVITPHRWHFSESTRNSRWDCPIS